MKTTGTTIKLGIVWLVLSVFTVMIIVVFGQVRFHHTTGYSAVFTHVSGLRAGQFVRAAGVEVGKVAKVTLIDGDKQVLVDFTVDRSLSLDQATTASIRYLNLIGDRYLELGRGHSGQRLAPGATIPLEHTHPALDLDALRVSPTLPNVGPRQGQQHRLLDHHRVPRARRHHQRHPRPDRLADGNAGRPGPCDR